MKKLKSIAYNVCINAVLLCAIFLYLTFIGQFTVVYGASMSPTLSEGDRYYVDKFTYLTKEPQRYDIIVFPMDDVHYVKRVIGIPGDTISIMNGSVYVNGSVLPESYIDCTTNFGGIASNPILLGEDEYFVLGDNRNNSKDSRDPTVGIITRNRIDGKITFQVYPFSYIGKSVY